MAFKIDKDILKNACEFLGVKHPVVITFRNYKHCGGRYKGLSWIPKIRAVGHQIDIASHITRGSYVNEAILHELTHAKQREDYGYYFHQVYNEQMEAIGLTSDAIKLGKALDVRYIQIRFEQEAIRNEAYSIKFPMTFKPVPKPKVRKVTEIKVIDEL